MIYLNIGEIIEKHDFHATQDEKWLHIQYPFHDQKQGIAKFLTIKSKQISPK